MASDLSDPMADFFKELCRKVVKEEVVDDGYEQQQMRIHHSVANDETNVSAVEGSGSGSGSTEADCKDAELEAQLAATVCGQIVLRMKDEEERTRLELELHNARLRTQNLIEELRVKALLEAAERKAKKESKSKASSRKKKRQTKYKYICPVCKKSSNKGSVLCIECREWVHFKCGGFDYSRRMGNHDFVCPGCRPKI